MHYNIRITYANIERKMGRLEKKDENLRSMTLKGYYEKLPDANYPRTEFVNRIIARTGKSVQTVRNWVIYGMKPKKTEHSQILSEETGIPVENLW